MNASRKKKFEIKDREDKDHYHPREELFYRIFDEQSILEEEDAKLNGLYREKKAHLSQEVKKLADIHGLNESKERKNKN